MQYSSVHQDVTLAADEISATSLDGLGPGLGPRSSLSNLGNVREFETKEIAGWQMHTIFGVKG